MAADTKTSRKNGGRRKKTDGLEDKHCICDSRDYTSLMICCDYCSIWYHVKCEGVKKGEVRLIEKYACKACQKNDKKIVYNQQKGSTAKGPNKRKQSMEKNSIGNKKSRTEMDKVKKEPADEGDQEGRDTSQNSVKQKRKKSLSTANAGQGQDEDATTQHQQAIKTEPLDPNSPTNASTSSQPPAVSLQIAKNQQLQKEHPELRCNNCIACIKDKDCGKCANCIYGGGCMCINRVCVQVEELFKRQQEKIKNEPMDVGDFEDLPKGSKKGRKPKQTIKQEPKETTAEPRRQRRSNQQNGGKEEISVASQLKKAYSEWMRNRQKTKYTGQQLPSELVEKQCIGPECTNSVRQGSRYCSEQCGLALAQIRLKTILPQRVNNFFGQVPTTQTVDYERLQRLEGQIMQISDQLKQLENWKDNLHIFVMALKNTQPTTEQQRNEDESMVMSCPVCAGEFSIREITKHTQSCYMRSERQTTYGTDYKMPHNRYHLYCEAYNKVNNTYCKRLRYACAEHYKDEYENDLKICGCPLNWNKNGGSLVFKELFPSPDVMMANGGYCQEKRKACRDHQNWIQTSFSLIDNERMNLLNRMDEKMDERRLTLNLLRERGDIISLLCNQAIRNGIVTENTGEAGETTSAFEKSSNNSGKERNFENNHATIN